MLNTQLQFGVNTITFIIDKKPPFFSTKKNLLYFRKTGCVQCTMYMGFIVGLRFSQITSTEQGFSKNKL